MESKEDARNMGKSAIKHGDENSNEFNYLLTLEDKLGKYVEKWIAVVNDEIVAEGNNATEVYKRAMELHPKSIPLIMKVPVDAVMIL
ncbi:MAG: DUF5678 domain-containing protein [Thermoplasmataceae archaeon]